MTFKSGANGVAKKGHTKGKNLGDSGSDVSILVLKLVVTAQQLKAALLAGQWPNKVYT